MAIKPRKRTRPMQRKTIKPAMTRKTHMIGGREVYEVKRWGEAPISLPMLSILRVVD